VSGTTFPIFPSLFLLEDAEGFAKEIRASFFMDDTGISDKVKDKDLPPPLPSENVSWS
jgi:hypothetical protein